MRKRKYLKGKHRFKRKPLKPAAYTRRKKEPWAVRSVKTAESFSKKLRERAEKRKYKGLTPTQIAILKRKPWQIPKEKKE
jgi:hypothetical protein